MRIQWRHDLSGDGGGNGGDGWWLSGSHVPPKFLPYTHVYAMQKIFYETMKYKKMNEWYFKIFMAPW
jgi:hypothetical protein